MDPLMQVSKPQNCNKHNQPILLYDRDPIKGAYCVICVQEKNGLISAESQQQKLNLIIKQETEASNANLQLFQDWHETILNHKNSMIMNLDKILQVIDDQIKIIRTNQEKLQQLSQSNNDYQKTSIDIELKSQNSQKENQQVKTQVKQQLLSFYKNFLNNIKSLLNYLCLKPKISIKEVQIDERKFQYELIKESSKEVKDKCQAFTFNKENNILFAACLNDIIVYEFNIGVIVKEIQILTDHTYRVNCLQFMNQSNSLVSGSEDKSIIIWGIDKKNNKWFNQFQLKDHERSVNCLAMNKREDLLISGSDDSTIKFWNKIGSRWSIQQTITANEGVYDISLNEKENKLIFCIWYSIQIVEKGSDNIWKIVQAIDAKGYRLCFTVGHQFVFQPIFFYPPSQMEVYGYNQVEKQFELAQVVKIPIDQQDEPLFPCQFIQNLNIVTAKFGKYLNIFKINSVGNYQLIQTIKFENIFLYGKLSDDGQYLVIQNCIKSIEMRTLKYME